MKPQDYKKLITRAFSENTIRGYADWRDCHSLYCAVTNLLEHACQDSCKAGQYKELFELCNKTLVRWCSTDKDDSNGETLEFNECIYEIWDVIYRNGEGSISHKRMLDELLALLGGKTFDGMEDLIYDFVLAHFKNEEELARKEQFLVDEMEKLKQQIAENGAGRYHLPVIEDYYVRVMADLRRPIQEIRDFLNGGDSWTKKELLAQVENTYENYPEAIALYRDLIAERPDPYWSDGHRKTLMEIYKKQGDTESYNDALYDMMLVHTGDDEYFLKYKALFSEKEWPAKWEAILDLFKDRLHKINHWLSIEGRYDLIMDNAEPDHESVIHLYEEKLFELYPERCLTVLANAADRYAAAANNRRDYKHITRLLLAMSSRPEGKKRAAELAAKYRSLYPRRRALLDEIKRF